MPAKSEPKFLSAITRQADGARFGLFATDDLAHPLLKAEEDEAGGFDLATAANPIVGQVAQLRSQLAGLVSAAGDGLNFLAPQQRIPQRLTRSLKLSQ